MCRPMAAIYAVQDLSLSDVNRAVAILPGT